MSGRRSPRLTNADRAASLLADIDALPRSASGGPRGSVQINTDIMIDAYSIIRAAAEDRRLNVSTYIRRAAMSLACHDLGLPVSEAISRDPRVVRDTGFRTTDPEGTKFGLWEIERLRGEDDDAGPEEEVAAGSG